MTTAEGPATAGLGRSQSSASIVNSFRLAAVAQRLALHLQASGPRDKTSNMDFFGCCISLARGIDFAIANNEVPAKAQDLPLLLKQVCQHTSDISIRAAIMVLMISVKNACKLGWFPQRENQELLALADEIGNYFCGSGNLTNQPKGPSTSFSQIMERFYPFVKLGHILLSVEVKPGYAAGLLYDFHISKSMPHSLQEKIRLFVAQMDNIETSACLVNPQQASFLVNGKGVEKRTNVSMDTGPQLPTDVTGMLKYGTNILQIMGQFCGDYAIVLAFTDVIPPPEKPVLKDYVESAIVEPNSDSDLIEGPSRISLDCPISRTRIKLPVKGHSCKHLQCFDFSNYIDINSRRPSWRCPHCNQPVCFTDIRVDQNMVKVLEEVGDNVSHVTISADGSWKAVTETDENMDPVHETERDPQDHDSFSNVGPTILDLTGDDNQMDTFGNSEVEDRKPLVSDLQCGANSANNTTAIDDDFFSGLCFPDGSAYSDPTIQNQFSAISDITQQTQVLLDQAFEQEHVRLSQIPQNVIRNPIAIQALPVQGPSTQQTPTTTTTSTTNGIHLSSHVQTSSVASFRNGFMERHQHLNRTHMNPSPRPAPTSSQNLQPVQNWNLRHIQRMDSIRSLSPGQLRPPSSSLPEAALTQHNRFYSGSQRAIQMDGPVNPRGQVQSVSRTDGVDLTSDTNWRPQGRMRGSLVSGSYNAALDHMIIRPTQSSETARPPSSLPVEPTQSPVQLPSHLQTLLANRRNHPTVAQSQTGSPSTVPGFSGVSM